MSKLSPFLIALLFGCGSASHVESTPSPDPTTPKTGDKSFNDTESSSAFQDTENSPPPPAPFTLNGEIRRFALHELLEKGPARLLANFDTKPHRAGGRFIGFRITAFKTPPPPGLDLRVDDVVIAVNGLKIVMPEDYFRVFQDLKKASNVRLNLLRNGQQINLTYPIID